jgi:AmpD protein
MQLGPDGIATGIRYVPSPNCDERPAGEPISLLVVHSISLPPGAFDGDAVERFFTNRLDPGGHPYFEGLREMRVSAHFFVRRDGEVVQFVPVGRRAWHAGVSEWRGRARCNDFSIGVELEGADDASFEPAQYGRLAEIVRMLHKQVPLEAITAHSDIAPGRKTDPGPLFEWRQCFSLIASD